MAASPLLLLALYIALFADAKVIRLQPACQPSAIPVFVLSLPEASARRARITMHLSRFNLSHHFVDGPRIKTMADARTWMTRLGMDAALLPADVSQGNLGFTLGWLNLLRAAVADGSPVTLLLEDDVVPVNDAAVAAYACNSTPFVHPDVDFLFVHPHIASHGWGTQAALVTQAGCRAILDAGPDMVRDLSWSLLDARILGGDIPGLRWSSVDRLGLQALFGQPESFECGFRYRGINGADGTGGHSVRCTLSDAVQVDAG